MKWNQSPHKTLEIILKNLVLMDYSDREVSHLLWNVRRFSLLPHLQIDQQFLLSKIGEFTFFSAYIEILRDYPQRKPEYITGHSARFHALKDFPKNTAFYIDAAKILNCAYHCHSYDLQKGIMCLENARCWSEAKKHAEASYQKVSGGNKIVFKPRSSIMFFKQYYAMLNEKKGACGGDFFLRSEKVMETEVLKILPGIIGKYQDYFNGFSVDEAIERILE